MHILSFHSDGPFPFCFKQLTTAIPQIPADLDLSGQTVLIAGANAGVGFQSARLHVKHKGRVIFAVRNMQKGETAAEKIREEFESAEIKVMKVDMESFDTIRTFVGELERSESTVDIAVLNAGIWRSRASMSPTGYDVHLQTNILGSVFLALLLVSTLRKTRVAFGSDFSVKLEKFPKSKISQPYHTSKLLTVLLAKQLTEKIDSSEVVVGLASPGYAESELLNEVRDSVVAKIGECIFARSGEGGRRLCMLAAIASTDAQFHKGYYSHAKWRQTSLYSRSAEGQEFAKDLWEQTMVIYEEQAPGVINLPTLLWRSV